VGLFRKRDEGGESGGDVEARVLERATAVPVENSNLQTEAIVLAGPIGLLGDEVVQAMPDVEQAIAASYGWFGFGLRSAELQLVDGAHDHGAASWGPIADLAIDAMSALDEDDLGSAVVLAASSLCTDDGRRVVFESVPGLPAATRERIIERWFHIESGGDNACLSRADRESLIVYGFAAGAVREYLSTALERARAAEEGRQPRW
jgi:hypothetical protein